MERDNYFNSIHDKSRFEQNAGSKISDTRHHDSVVTDRNAVTANGLDHARSIHDKLSEYKYAVAETPAYTQGETTSYVAASTPAETEQTKYTVDEPSGFRTETELHYSGASSSLYQTQENVVTGNSTSRGQSYIAMMQGRDRHTGSTDKRSSQSGSRYRSNESANGQSSLHNYKTESTNRSNTASTNANNRVVGPYVSFGKYGKSDAVSIERSSGRYSDTASRAKAAFGRSADLSKGKFAGYSSDRPLSRTETHVNAQRYKTYGSIYLGKLTTQEEMGKGLQRQITLDSKNRATQRYKRYRMSTGRVEDVEGGPTTYVTKKGTVISSKITQKAKGTEDTKAKTIAKLSKDQKASFSKKTVGVKGASGKFKKKINSGVRNTTGKVRDVALGAAAYKIVSDDESNAAVKAMVASGRASYQTARAVNRKANNANAQKFFNKIKGKSTEKASGKYVTKARKGVSDSASKAAKQRAQQQAQKKLQQMNILKKFRAARAKEIHLETVFQEVKQAAIKIAKKLIEFARRNATVIIAVAAILIIFVVISAGLSSCAMAFSQGTGTYAAGTSGSTDYDMTDSDSYFTKMEMELQERMDNIEEEYPDYDEYVMNVADIGHDATKLMAYLTAKYESYTLADVQSELDELFDLLYIITIEEETQIRTRTVEKEAEDGTKYEVEEEYEWKILYVTVEKKDFDSIVTPRLPDDNAKEMYDIYKDTGGAHQAFYNPFTVDWSQHVSSEFGWRIHPITGKEKFHNGIDIAMPTGTEVHASSSGTVIQSYYSESAGNYVVVQDETGYTAHYMHLNSRAVAVGDVIKHGEIIGTVGSTGNSTGPHLHFGVKDASGEWINPRFVLSDFVKD